MSATLFLGLALFFQDPSWSLPPLLYGQGPVNNRVERLAQSVHKGEVRLEREGGSRLRSLLAALDIPAESQTAVFARTSFQGDMINAQHPRALYFNDDVYVGFVPDSSVLELTAMDPKEGLVFYTLSEGDPTPRFEREVDRCLQCHAPAHMGQMPANLIRSVHPSPGGLPLLRAGSQFVDHTTQYEERWGGWYVTGDTGEMKHLGNRHLSEGQEQLDPQASDQATLEGLCDTMPYPAATSDIVALLVLEHQAHVQNVVAWAGYEARRALHYQEGLSRDLGMPDGSKVDSTQVRLEATAVKVVDALLLVGEPALPNAVGNRSAFARVFQNRARRDLKGRSLRDLDLDKRLFRYPLSYMIHSELFAALPQALLDRIWLRLWLVLNGILNGTEDPYLVPDDREAIQEILRQTFEGTLPKYW